MIPVVFGGLVHFIAENNVPYDVLRAVYIADAVSTKSKFLFLINPSKELERINPLYFKITRRAEGLSSEFRYHVVELKDSLTRLNKSSKGYLRTKEILRVFLDDFDNWILMLDTLMEDTDLALLYRLTLDNGDMLPESDKSKFNYLSAEYRAMQSILDKLSNIVVSVSDMVALLRSGDISDDSILADIEYLYAEYRARANRTIVCYPVRSMKS